MPPYVAQIREEGVDFVQARKLCHHRRQFLRESSLDELDFPQIEITDPRDLVAWVDDGRRMSLCLGQNDVDQIVRGRDGFDLLEFIHGGREEKFTVSRCWKMVKKREGRALVEQI